MGVHLGSGEVARLAQRGAFRPIVAGTAFEHLYPHDLRHYVAGVLDDSGLREGEIADVPRMNASARRKRTTRSVALSARAQGSLLFSGHRPQARVES